mgnify:CR=1 FL=1
MGLSSFVLVPLLGGALALAAEPDADTASLQACADGSAFACDQSLARFAQRLARTSWEGEVPEWTTRVLKTLHAQRDILRGRHVRRPATGPASLGEGLAEPAPPPSSGDWAFGTWRPVAGRDLEVTKDTFEGVTQTRAELSPGVFAYSLKNTTPTLWVYTGPDAATRIRPTGELTRFGRERPAPVTKAERAIAPPPQTAGHIDPQPLIDRFEQGLGIRPVDAEAEALRAFRIARRDLPMDQVTHLQRLYVRWVIHGTQASWDTHLGSTRTDLSPESPHRLVLWCGSCAEEAVRFHELTSSAPDTLLRMLAPFGTLSFDADLGRSVEERLGHPWHGTTGAFGFAFPDHLGLPRPPYVFVVHDGVIAWNGTLQQLADHPDRAAIWAPR